MPASAFVPTPPKRPPLRPREGLTLRHPKHPTKSFVTLEDLQILDTLSPRQVQAHERENHLLIGPTLLLGADLYMLAHRGRQTHDAGQLQIGTQASMSGNGPLVGGILQLERQQSLTHVHLTEGVIKHSPLSVLIPPGPTRKVARSALEHGRTAVKHRRPSGYLPLLTQKLPLVIPLHALEPSTAPPIVLF